MYDPQTIQMIAVLVSLGFLLVLILCLFYGLIQLAKIRKQAVGINRRLDALLARTAPGQGTLARVECLSRKFSACRVLLVCGFPRPALGCSDYSFPSLLARVSMSLRFGVVMPSKILISLRIDFDWLACGGTCGAVGCPDPRKRS